MIFLVSDVADNSISIFSMILKGGWLMLPIFILSILSIYIFFERYSLLRKFSTNNAQFMQLLREDLLGNNDALAISSCVNENTPMSRILIKGIQYITLPTHELRANIESNANIEVAKLEKGLSTLATSAGLAPMIGFLGTVVGMVQAFYDMSLAGSNVDISLLSGGIYTAMVTTVAGLTVGIIALFAYNSLTSRVNKIASNMESVSAEFMEIVYERNNK